MDKDSADGMVVREASPSLCYPPSSHDQLTGLFNRSYFLEELGLMDKESYLPISLIMGDINGLKLVNDAFNYREGDRLLLEFTMVLKKCCRQEDIIARWGGDEFAVLMPRTNPQAASRVCRSIEAVCKKAPKKPIELFASVGRASKEYAAQDILEMLKRAEADMHMQKLSGSRDFCKSVITSLVKTLGEKDYETEIHTWRMQKMAVEFGIEIGLNEKQLDELSLAVTLHDIGKIAVPEDILLKKGAMTAAEWELIREHSARGYRLALSSSELAPVAPYILSHHERWDGEGYPHGLKGAEIPLISRIISLADAVDVMRYGRPYKQPLSCAEVIEELNDCAGSQFDPHLVPAFIQLLLDSAN